ncbi:MAG: AbrB family transcriptional regulator [Pseudomonadota bacterium]
MISAQKDHRSIVAAIALGTAGGTLFYVLNLPLPWMLGAIIVTLIGTLAKWNLTGPEKARPYVVAVIGVMLGSGFKPDTFDHLGQWAVSLIGLVVCVAASAFLVQEYLHRFGGQSRVTAIFSAMPGGVVEMVEVGRAEGGDEKAIILAHVWRIILVIAAIAVWFRFVLGFEVDGTLPMSPNPTGPMDLLVLAVCAVLGSALGLGLRLPAPTFIGPMVLSAAAHMTGLTYSSPPLALVVAAQIVLGVIVGCRFKGSQTREIFHALKLALVSTIIMMAVAASLAWRVHRITGHSPVQLLLAYAPGGLNEMSIVSLAIQADVAFVATHHLFRIVALLALAGTVLARLAKAVNAASKNTS